MGSRQKSDLEEFMDTFPDVPLKIVRHHRPDDRGDCCGCATGTRFVRFPCHLVLAARRVLHVGQSKVQSGEAGGHDR
jgi:hypothetical protein